MEPLDIIYPKFKCGIYSGHSLYYTRNVKHNEDGWIKTQCKNCKRDIGKRAGRWTCGWDSYDICTDCWPVADSVFDAVTTCHNGHTLKWSRKDSGGFHCDFCVRLSIPCHSGRYNCPSCFYDICEQCYLAHVPSEMIEKHYLMRKSEVIPPMPATGNKPPLDDFSRLDLRVGKIINAEVLKDKKGTLQLEVELGDHKVHKVSSHNVIGPHELINKKAVFLCNGDKGNMRGPLCAKKVDLYELLIPSAESCIVFFL